MTAPVLEVHHPDDETLAAFVDDRANEETREKVIAHMAACGECRELVLMTSDVVAEETNVVHGRFGGRWIAPLAAAAAAGAALFFISDGRELVFGQNPAALASPAQGLKKRTTPGRTAVAVPYHRYWNERGVGETDEALARARLDGVRAKNEDALRPNRRTSGVAQLLVAQSADEFSAAIADLEAAYAGAEGAERDAVAMDLAAALLGRNRYRGSEEPRPEAQRAWELAEELWGRTKSLDAAWNRAAAFQSLGRDKEAIAAWEIYLKLDPNSPWADEARGNIYLLTN